VATARMSEPEVSTNQWPGRRLHLSGPGGDALRAGRGAAVADGPVGGHAGRGPDRWSAGGRRSIRTRSSDRGTVMERLTGVIRRTPGARRR
jgi:hypothetical protein